jgi:hypothetical protein
VGIVCLGLASGSKVVMLSTRRWKDFGGVGRRWNGSWRWSTATATTTLLAIGNRHFGWIHRVQEWRYGRKIDETLDWQAFTDAFKVEK